MRSLRSLFGEPLDRTNRQHAEAAVVARAVVARIEEEVPRVVVARARNGRPIVAARTDIVERRPNAVASTGKEDAVGSIIASAANDVSFHTVLRGPSPVAFVVEVGQLLLRRNAPVAAPMHMRRVMLRRKDSAHRDPSFTP